MKIWTLALNDNKSSKIQTATLANKIKEQLFHKTSVVIEEIIISEIEKKETSHTQALTPEQMSNVICETGSLEKPYPDIVIGCRPEVAALALTIKKESNNSTKIIQIQTPNFVKNDCVYNFGLQEFDIIVPQKYEGIKGDNIINTILAIHDITRDGLKGFNKPSIRTSDRKILGVLVGGEDEYIKISDDMSQQFAEDITFFTEKNNLDTYVLTSRRTGKKNTNILKSAFKDNPNIKVDSPDVQYQEILATADCFLVTGESISMMAEALVPGKPVMFYDFNGYLQTTIFEVTLNDLTIEERAVIFDRNSEPKESKNTEPFDELPDLAKKIIEKLNL